MMMFIFVSIYNNYLLLFSH